jgi:rhodanese-related sulfurtransferase
MQSLDDLLFEARSGLTRVAPEELADASRLGALVVDIRDSGDLASEGVIPGSVHIPRSVLEWRLAPTSEWRSHILTADSLVILVCSEGFSSTLAAANLQKLGLSGATDLIGGYRAWTASTSLASGAVVA